MHAPARLVVFLILLSAFGIRMLAAYYWHSAAGEELFRLGDSHSYWTLGEQLGRGLPYQYGSPDASIFRAPLYPLLLTPLTWIGDTSQAVWLARVLGCGLGTLTVWLIMRLARRLGGQRASLFAGLLAAIYPSGVGMSVVVLSEALALPLMLGHILLWQRAWSTASAGRFGPAACSWSVVAGIVAGAAILSRPSWLLFGPMLCGCGLLFGPRRMQHLWIFVATLVGISLIMSPWWIRNARITGKFVPTTLQVGPSLYDGWHPGATGASDEGMQFMQRLQHEQREADRLTEGPLESTFEWRVNRRAQRQAVAWAAENPWEVLRLGGVKLLRTWSPWPDGGQLSSNTMRLAISLSCFGIVLLALLGSIRLRATHSWWLAVSWLPCLYFTLLHMVFVGSIRYREPAVFMLVAVAGCAALWLPNGKHDSTKPGD